WRSAQVRARPRFRAAQAADTALHVELVAILVRHGARIGLAVIGIVDSPGPPVGSGRAHPDEQRDADDPAVAQRRIFVLVIDLRLAGRAVDRLAQPHHGAAKAAAAAADADLGIAGLGQPDTADV